MADTTRPFHWGRPNPDYTGPQRAQSARSADSVAPPDDFTPGDRPGDVDALADDLDPEAVMDATGVPVTDSGPDFASLVPVASELVAEYVDDNPGETFVDAEEIISGYSFGTCTEGFMMSSAEAADHLDHVAAYDEPVAELARVGREYGFEVTDADVREHMVRIGQMYAGADQAHSEVTGQDTVDGADDTSLYRHHVLSGQAHNTRDISVAESGVSVYDMSLMAVERDARRVLARSVTELADRLNDSWN